MTRATSFIGGTASRTQTQHGRCGMWDHGVGKLMWLVEVVFVVPGMILLAAQSRLVMGAIGARGVRPGRTAACSSRSARGSSGCFAAADSNDLPLGRGA